MVGDEGDFAEAARSFVDGDELLQDVVACFGVGFDDLAVFKYEAELVDDVAVIDQGLRAVYDAVYAVGAGSRVDFFRRDIGV